MNGTGSGAPALSARELTVPAESRCLPEVTSFINRHLEAMHCSHSVRMAIDIAADEIFANIVRYAYRDTDKGSVTVRVGTGTDPNEVLLTFIDDGRPFDPLSAETPDTTLPAKKRRIGGLGLFMVKNTMDGIDYVYRDGRNVLTLRKKIRTNGTNSAGSEAGL